MSISIDAEKAFEKFDINLHDKLKTTQRNGKIYCAHGSVQFSCSKCTSPWTAGHQGSPHHHQVPGGYSTYVH